jgi:6-phosphogluconolactonase
MNTKVVPGSLIAVPGKDEVSAEAADRIERALVDAIRNRGSAVIALSGGNTPKDSYARLAKRALDWSKILFVFVDERAVPPTSDRSNFHMVNEALFLPAKVPADRILRMQGEAQDLDAEAARYEAELRAKVRLKKEGQPNIDVVILGIGDDGHTASLFPGEDTVKITDKLVASVPARGEREARLTMTVPILEMARSTFVLAVGASKHEPLERVWRVQGDVSVTPARIVKNYRGAVTWIIDRAAGGLAG